MNASTKELFLTPPEAASTLLSKVYSGVGYFSAAIARRLEPTASHILERHIPNGFDPEHAAHWQALFADTQRSQSLVARVDQVLSARTFDQLSQIPAPERLEPFKKDRFMLIPVEELILRLRFGIDDGIIRIRMDIAEIAGIQTKGSPYSIDRIGSLEARALRKLLRPTYTLLFMEFLPEPKSN